MKNLVYTIVIVNPSRFIWEVQLAILIKTPAKMCQSNVSFLDIIEPQLGYPWNLRTSQWMESFTSFFRHNDVRFISSDRYKRGSSSLRRNIINKDRTLAPRTAKKEFSQPSVCGGIICRALLRAGAGMRRYFCTAANGMWGRVRFGAAAWAPRFWLWTFWRRTFGRRDYLATELFF